MEGARQLTCKSAGVPMSTDKPQSTRSALSNSCLPAELLRAFSKACLHPKGQSYDDPPM